MIVLRVLGVRVAEIKMTICTKKVEVIATVGISKKGARKAFSQGWEKQLFLAEA